LVTITTAAILKLFNLPKAGGYSNKVSWSLMNIDEKNLNNF
jgi:hypothetical protein